VGTEIRVTMHNALDVHVSPRFIQENLG
jgi:hypothetical protein